MALCRVVAAAPPLGGNMKLIPQNRARRWLYLFLNAFSPVPDRLKPLEYSLLQHLLAELPQPYRDAFETQLNAYSVFQSGPRGRSLEMYRGMFRRTLFPPALRVPTEKDEVRLASIKFRIPGETETFNAVFVVLLGLIRTLEFNRNYQPFRHCDEIEIVKVDLNHEVLPAVDPAEWPVGGERRKKIRRAADRQTAGTAFMLNRLPIKVTRQARTTYDPGHEQTIEVEGGNVIVSEHFFAGRAVWSQPIDAFTGVLLRSRENFMGPPRSPIFHTVGLIHPNPDRKFSLDGADRDQVTFYESEKLLDAYRVWENLAGLLNLPALDETPSGIQRRDAADFGKPIRDLQRNDDNAEDVLSSSVPSGIKKSNGNGERPRFLVDDLVQPHNDFNHYFLPVAILAAFGGLLMIFTDNESVPNILGRVILMVAFWGILIRMVVDLAELNFAITPKQACYWWKSRFRNFRRTSIDLADLHLVRRADIREGAAFLFLVSDSAEIRLGYLTPKQAAWLERFALAGATGSLED